MSAPNLRHERALLRSGFTAVACIDEVGRGALCGPVTVGVVVVTAASKPAPSGVHDSKMLTPARREELRPLVERWAIDRAVAHSSADEIDEIGIIGALRLAAMRAMGSLTHPVDVVLLDGSHDYLTAPAQPDLFEDQLPFLIPVRTMVKADMKCAGVAAASILAKTSRDAIMHNLSVEHPEYGWAENKGYSAPEHLAALATHGTTSYHRRSWNLPGIGERAGAHPA